MSDPADEGMTPEEEAAFYERKRKDAEYSRTKAAEMEKKGNQTWKLIVIGACVLILIGIVWGVTR